MTAPLCKNCVHFRRYAPFVGMTSSNHRCARRKHWNPVGGDYSKDVDAHSERRRSILGRDRCGPDGRYFEPPPAAGDGDQA